MAPPHTLTATKCKAVIHHLTLSVQFIFLMQSIRNNLNLLSSLHLSSGSKYFCMFYKEIYIIHFTVGTL